jgi:hypothetical protein
VVAPRTPSVYRTRSYVLRRRIVTGLAGAALLLTGYGIGRWQDTPAPVALPPAATSAAVSPPSAAPPSQAPTPTVYQTLQAEAADALDGIQTQDTEDEGGGQNAGWIAGGDSLRFDDVDFGPVPATKLEARVASDGGDGGRMEIHIDSPEKTPVGVLTVTGTGGWQSWRTDVATITPVTGLHTVFLTFARDGGGEFVNVNCLLFEH